MKSWRYLSLSGFCHFKKEDMFQAEPLKSQKMTHLFIVGRVRATISDSRIASDTVTILADRKINAKVLYIQSIANCDQ